MGEIKKYLTSAGHTVYLPDPEDDEHVQNIINQCYIDTHQIKIKYDYIRKHYNQIVRGDCLLVANYDKAEVKNYIGGHTFLEMGFAYVLGKPIYLLNPIPKISFYYHEMVAMEPVILRGDISRIPKSIQ
uniref:Maf-like protein n=1 Tax=candidate division WWE3 bacterium TaxID=2053526 RepID=A0A831Z2T8_UNCKA